MVPRTGDPLYVGTMHLTECGCYIANTRIPIVKACPLTVRMISFINMRRNKVAMSHGPFVTRRSGGGVAKVRPVEAERDFADGSDDEDDTHEQEDEADD